MKRRNCVFSTWRGRPDGRERRAGWPPKSRRAPGVAHRNRKLPLAEPESCHYTSPRFATGPSGSEARDLRLSVRTPAFHAGETGSTPVGRATIIFCILISFKVRLTDTRGQRCSSSGSNARWPDAKRSKEVNSAQAPPAVSAQAPPAVRPSRHRRPDASSHIRCRLPPWPARGRPWQKAPPANRRRRAPCC